MERVNNHNSKLNPNFINSWIIEPLSLCDDLIEYFELNKANQKKGITVEEVSFRETAKQEGLFRCSTLPLERQSL